MHTPDSILQAALSRGIISDRNCAFAAVLAGAAARSPDAASRLLDADLETKIAAVLHADSSSASLSATREMTRRFLGGNATAKDVDQAIARRLGINP